MSLKENWKIFIVNSARRNLKNIPTKDRARIMEAIDLMAANPLIGDVIKLGSGDNSWRQRIGNYRTIFELKNTERIVYIYTIERRTSNTY